MNNKIEDVITHLEFLSEQADLNKFDIDYLKNLLNIKELPKEDAMKMLDGATEVSANQVDCPHCHLKNRTEHEQTNFSAKTMLIANSNGLGLVQLRLKHNGWHLAIKSSDEDFIEKDEVVFRCPCCNRNLLFDNIFASELLGFHFLMLL